MKLPFHGRPACADADPDAFFPDKGHAAEPALSICLDLCPARRLRQCASWAVSEPAFSAVGSGGVVGGTTPRDRQDWRAGRRTLAQIHADNRTRIGLDRKAA